MTPKHQIISQSRDSLVNMISFKHLFYNMKGCIPEIFSKMDEE